MKLLITRPLLGIVTAGSAAVAILACGSSSNPRDTFDDVPDGPVASLPEAAAPVDAGPPTDTGTTKPAFDPDDEAVTCARTPCAVQLVAGERHFCARMNDGTVRCWGDDTRGSLGVVTDVGDADAGDAGVVADAGDAGAFAIEAVTSLASVKSISAGGSTTCALGADGGVQCWGGNDRGQLGRTSDPATSDHDPHPAIGAVALASPAARVDVGAASACAVLTNGELWCWGDNAQRQLARVSPSDVGGPAKSELGSLGFVRTAAGTSSAFGVTTTGDVFSWGAVAGPDGSLAARVASVSPDAEPLSIGLGSITSLSVSSTTIIQSSGGGFPRPPPQYVAHACAIAKGQVYCWGASLLGALATGLPDPAPAPLPAPCDSEEAWPQQVAVGGDITCVRLTDGSVQCAGDNTRGALGKDPTNAYSMFFKPAEAFTGHAVQVAVSNGSVCALVQGGSVACWGSNEHGELGLGTTDLDPHSTPNAISF